MSRHEQLVRYL